jgi:hypothetical protein
MFWKRINKPSTQAHLRELQELMDRAINGFRRIMTSIKDIDNNEQAVETGFAKLKADIEQLIADENLSGPLVDTINARLLALATAMGTTDTEITVADPGSGSAPAKG